MSDTTTPAAQAATVNANTPPNILGDIWNGITNTFSTVAHTVESYWQTAAVAAATSAQASVDAARQQTLNGVTPAAAANGGGMDTNTLLLLGLGAVVLILVARK